MPSSPGIHHISAITIDAQRNLDFYAGTLALRLVKQTVNLEDPDVYHLFYGDESGSPGSVMSFFVWPGSHRGQQGAGQVAVTSFAIHPTSLAFWIDRLLLHGVRFDGPMQRPSSRSGTESVLAFRDPDGLLLEIVTHLRARNRPSWGGVPGVPLEHAIHGFHSVTLWVADPAATGMLLANELGFHSGMNDGSRERFIVAGGEPAQIVNVRTVRGFVRGSEGGGTVHHVAWEIPDDSDFGPITERLSGSGFDVSTTIDRKYFKAAYLREHDGVLHELATSLPGFTIDEPVERLGERLMIPEEWADRRGEIERHLPPLRLAPPLSSDSWLPAPLAPSPTSPREFAFRHSYQPASNNSRSTLLLLHGTGGDENSLVGLGSSLAPDAALLSPHGNVLEGKSYRFFRRDADGILDQVDLKLRTNELKVFIEEAMQLYGFGATDLIAVGFSNGANILASLLFRYPGLVRGVILLSPMMPFEPEATRISSKTSVFLGAGSNDPLVPPEQVERLAKALDEAGADVTVYWHEAGHSITPEEVSSAKTWLTVLIPEGEAGNF